MKRLQRILFLAAVLFIHPMQAQVTNPDTMIRRVFATLQAKDAKAYVALYPNAKQFGTFVGNMMQQMLKSPEMKQMMEKDEKSKNMNTDSVIAVQVAAVSSPEAFAKMTGEFSRNFQQTISKGEKKGVNWSNASLTSYTLDSSTTEAGPFQPAGMKTLKGVIDFTSDNKPYQLAYENVIFLPAEGGWYGGEFVQLARKGESLARDGEALPKEAADAMDEATSAPKAKAKTRTVTKKAGAKKTVVKTKSKAK